MHVNGEIELALQALGERLERGSATLGQKILAQWPSVAGATVRLVAESPGGDYAGVSLQFPDGDGTNPPTMPPADANGTPLMAAPPAIWMSLLEGRANIMDEIVTGRLRCFNPNDSHRIRSDEVHAVGALLGLASVPAQPL